MPISPSPTQVGLSVANAAELSTVSVTQFSSGEIAYKKDDKTYWSLDLSVTASGGYPTASGQGRWVPFPTGGGSPTILNSDWSFADATVNGGPDFVYDTSGVPAKTMAIRFPTPAGPPTPAGWHTSVWAAPFANASTMCVLWYDAPDDGSAPPLQVGSVGILYPGEKGWLAQYPAGTQLLKFVDTAALQSDVTDWYINTNSFANDLNNGSSNWPLATMGELWRRNGGVFDVNTTIHVNADTGLVTGLVATTSTNGLIEISVQHTPTLVPAGPTSGLVGYTEHNTPVGTNNPSIVTIPTGNPQINEFPQPLYLLDGGNNEIDFAWILEGDPVSGTYMIGPWHVGGIAAPGVPYNIGESGLPDGAACRGLIEHEGNIQVTYVHMNLFFIGQQNGDNFDRCFFGDASTPNGSPVDTLTPHGTMCTSCCFQGTQSFSAETYSLSRCGFSDATIAISNATVNLIGASFVQSSIVVTGGSTLSLLPGANSNAGDVGCWASPGNNIIAFYINGGVFALSVTNGDFGPIAPILYGGAPDPGGFLSSIGPVARGVTIAASSYFSIDPSYVALPPHQPTLLAALPANKQITIGLAGVDPNPVVGGIPQAATPLNQWVDLFNVATFNGTAINLAIGAFIGTPA